MEEQKLSLVERVFYQKMLQRTSLFAAACLIVGFPVASFMAMEVGASYGSMLLIWSIIAVTQWWIFAVFMNKYLEGKSGGEYVRFKWWEVDIVRFLVLQMLTQTLPFFSMFMAQHVSHSFLLPSLFVVIGLFCVQFIISHFFADWMGQRASK